MELIINFQKELPELWPFIIILEYHLHGQALMATVLKIGKLIRGECDSHNFTNTGCQKWQ